MPVDKDLDRMCQCTQCARTAKGFKMLKYGTHYKHQKDEQELRWRLEYRARTAEAQLLTQKRSRTPSEQGDVGMRDGFVPDDAEALQSTDFPPSRVATPEVAQPPPETPRWGSLSPIPKIPSRSSTPPPPTNSRSPSPLEIDYDSDESESDYTLPEHVFDDPPNLRLTYLNAICDHVVRKMTVRNAETSLRNTLNTLRLTPNALPPHITPLTTLKSIRKHLRINASSLMRTVPVCSKCYKRYTFDDVSNLEIPTTCTRERPSCKGAFAKLEVTDGREKRVPTKVLIYSKVPASLRFMFLRPSFVNGLLDGAKARKLPRPENTLYDPSDGTAWNLARIGLRRIFRQDGSVSDEVITPGRDFLVSSLGYGIFAVLNIDWFSLTKKRSCGAIYLAILNLPRQIRYQIQNVILACMISGPHEPSLEDLNFVLEPIVEAFKRLYAGVWIRIYNEALPKQVYVYPLMVDADVPGRSKVQGVPSHAHGKRIGCDCDVCQGDVNTVRAYKADEFVYHDEWHILQLAKQATGGQAARNRIAKDHGIHWSVLNELPGWMPHASAPFDPMHCLYLGIVNSLWCNVIEDGYLLSTQQKSRFADFLSGLQWPSQIGRLPSPTTAALNRNKADEWRRLISILPVALWIAWRNNTDTIGLPPPVPEQAAKKPTFTRHLRPIWNSIVFLTISIRLFTSWIACLPDIDRAQGYLELYCQGLLRLGIRLQPNHHFAMHLKEYVKKYGPCYGWWLFAFERFNGILEEIRTNGHPDEAESILARWWVTVHQIHNYLERLPGAATPEEKDVLRQLCSIKSDRGTLLSMTQALHGEDTPVQPSRIGSRFVNLRDLDETGEIYLAVLGFAQRRWPHLNLVSDLDFNSPGRLFLSKNTAKPFQSVIHNTVRYGSASSKRTSADRYALVLGEAGRYPVKILRHFRLEVAGEEPDLCTVVTRLNMNDSPLLPWSINAFDLGYYTAVNDRFEPAEGVSPNQLVSSVTHGTFKMLSSGQELRVVIAYDRTGCEMLEGLEPEYPDDGDDV